MGKTGSRSSKVINPAISIMQVKEGNEIMASSRVVAIEMIRCGQSLDMPDG